MRKVIPKNIADEMSKPYIDDAVDKQLKAADVPPRNKLDISFKDAGRTDDNKDYESNQEAYEKNHGKLYDMTHKNTIPWRNYVVYLVLLSLLTCVFTFSKYMSGATGSGAAAVAKFYVETKGAISSTDYSINPIVSDSGISSILSFDENTQSKTLYVKVTSDSDVTVDVSATPRTSSICEIKSVTQSGRISAKSTEPLILEYTIEPKVPDDVESRSDFDKDTRLWQPSDKIIFDVSISQVD